jgi:hypothetical protein
MNKKSKIKKQNPHLIKKKFFKFYKIKKSFKKTPKKKNDIPTT